MDFDLNWTIEDARMVTRQEYEAVMNDPENKDKIDNLARKGRMFTDSLRTINTYCMPELANYRASLASHSSSNIQNRCLDQLYEKYCDNMAKTVLIDAFSSFKGFLRFVFE